MSAGKLPSFEQSHVPLPDEDALDISAYLKSETDELGRVTKYFYDRADRLIRVELSDPDAGGPLTAPVTIAMLLWVP